jgi:hypothetical protein
MEQKLEARGTELERVAGDRIDGTDTGRVEGDAVRLSASVSAGCVRRRMLHRAAARCHDQVALVLRRDEATGQRPGSRTMSAAAVLP